MFKIAVLSGGDVNLNYVIQFVQYSCTINSVYKCVRVYMDRLNIHALLVKQYL